MYFISLSWYKIFLKLIPNNLSTVVYFCRRSHAVLQSTLPQKEEYVLLVRMTPLQRKLYDRFMNEVVRSASVPNPLKAFAICCKV